MLVLACYLDRMYLGLHDTSLATLKTEHLIFTYPDVLHIFEKSDPNQFALEWQYSFGLSIISSTAGKTFSTHMTSTEKLTSLTLSMVVDFTWFQYHPPVALQVKLLSMVKP